jgi:phage N-6-adenine-methyltransferase
VKRLSELDDKPAIVRSVHESEIRAINALEQEIVKSEDKADAKLWEQAGKVVEQLETGMSQRTLAAQWISARTGKPYSVMHVNYVAKAYAVKFTLQPRPRFRDAYNEIANASKASVHFASATDDWETPQALFDLLDSEFHFTLDVCATKENAKCARYFSKNGLTESWEGVCWMNPPYGDAIGDWVAKAHESGDAGATVVCLVPARTDTNWWWDHCRFGEVRFLRGRLRFGGATTGAPFPSALAIFERPACVVWWEEWNG